MYTLSDLNRGEQSWWRQFGDHELFVYLDHDSQTWVGVEVFKGPFEMVKKTTGHPSARSAIKTMSFSYGFEAKGWKNKYSYYKVKNARWSIIRADKKWKVMGSGYFSGKERFDSLQQALDEINTRRLV